ncbi:excalibur calcium-binding domain-containing protein [Arthrobacter sp. CP30]
MKAKYELWMTEAEHAAIRGILESCTDQQAPAEAPEAPAAEPAPAEIPAAPAAPEGEVVYANCAEVKAAGAAPISAGDPGFSPKFDGNGDGVGCEA